MELIAFAALLALNIIVLALSLRFKALAFGVFILALLTFIPAINDGALTYTTMACTTTLCSPQTVSVAIDRTALAAFLFLFSLLPIIIFFKAK